MIYVALDLETTGLEPGSRIVEIAAIAFDHRKTGGFHAMVNPGMPVPPDSAAINGADKRATDELLETEDALCRLLEWLNEDAVIVAHNAPYDTSILSWEAERCGIKLPPLKVIDTLQIARTLGETKRNGLQALVEHYGIERIGEAHTAMCDADACMKYFTMVAAKHDPVPADWPVEYSYVRPLELPEALRQLPELVAAGADFKFGYQDGKGAVTERAIIPYGWARKNDELYFHGLCMLRGERRTFRADRIVTATQEAA